MSDIWNRVSQSLYDGVDSALFRLRDGSPDFAKCESEIERAFFATFVVMCRLSQIPLSHDFSAPDGPGIILVPQVDVPPYRVDFVLGRPGWKLPQCIVVECDGHDFHDRTKEQAARDKSRDRFLNTAVSKVIRFTGSEIFRDPSHCGGEAIQILMSMPRVK